MFESTSSESLEAIDFFTTAHQFNIPHTQDGIEAMLALVFSPDANIKEAMMNSYKTIYLSIEDGNNSTTKSVTVMKNINFFVNNNNNIILFNYFQIMTRLINLIKTLNVVNRKAFKCLLNEWIKNKTLDDDCVMILWAWFTKTVIISEEDRVVATLLLSLIARYYPCS